MHRLQSIGRPLVSADGRYAVTIDQRMKPAGESPMRTHEPGVDLPDVRDGLTHRERIVLQCLNELQQERGGRPVPTGMLYGSVVEHITMSLEEMQSILVRLGGHKLLSS